MPTPLAAAPIAAWLPIALNLIQFLLLCGLTYYVFAKNAQQKVAEREANWYHKIVVDHCIDLLASFFQRETQILCECIVELDQFRVSKQEEDVDKLIRGTLANFKARLHTLNADASGRLSFFDKYSEQRFLNRMDKLEDEVTEWFNIYKNAQPFDNRCSFPHILTECQNYLLETIKSYEFQTWGWPIKKRRAA